MKKLVSIAVIVGMCLALFGCGVDKQVEDTITKIAAIGEVSLENESVIKAAENAYNALSYEQKAEVENYSELKEARAQYDKLVELQPMQDFAAKLFTEMAKEFINPLSIEIKNVWGRHSEFSEDYKFTFEFDIESKGGITRTVFYGNDLFGFEELSDEEISEAYKYWFLGIDFYFVENGISAMQYGEPLDAEAIQEYFMKNYKE